MSNFVIPNVADRIIATTFGRIETPREAKRLAERHFQATLTDEEARYVLRRNHKLYPRKQQPVNIPNVKVICLEGNRLL